jgi:hypothetical protein
MHLVPRALEADPSVGRDEGGGAEFAKFLRQDGF